MEMSSTLNEKSLAALQDGTLKLGDELGVVAAPTAGGLVKNEFPSLQPLKEILKTSKTSQLHLCLNMFTRFRKLCSWIA